MRTLPTLGLLVLTATALVGCGTVQPYVDQIGSAPGKADDAQAQADLAAAKVAYLSFVIENSAAPTTSSELAEFGYSPSDGVSAAHILAGSGPATFCLDLQSGTGTSFKTTAGSQVAEGACAASDL